MSGVSDAEERTGVPSLQADRVRAIVRSPVERTVEQGLDRWIVPQPQLASGPVVALDRRQETAGGQREDGGLRRPGIQQAGTFPRMLRISISAAMIRNSHSFQAPKPSARSVSGHGRVLTTVCRKSGLRHTPSVQELSRSVIVRRATTPGARPRHVRSEEHTSELQSLAY